MKTARGTRARGTRQAQALAVALEDLPGFCSAQEIHAALRSKGEHVGLATVYRHLQALSEAGSIDTIRDAGGETLYRQCGTSVHHHHLTCRNCGRSVEVEGRAVEQWAEKVAAEAGFTDVTTPSNSSASVPSAPASFHDRGQLGAHIDQNCPDHESKLSRCGGAARGSAAEGAAFAFGGCGGG